MAKRLVRFLTYQNAYGVIATYSFMCAFVLVLIYLGAIGSFKNMKATFDQNVFDKISISVPEMKYNEEDKKYWTGYSEITNNSSYEVRNIEIKFYVYGQDNKIWDITDRDVYETIKPGESTTIEVYVPQKTGLEEIKFVTPQIKRIFIKPKIQFTN